MADAVLEREFLSDRKLELPLVTLVVINRNYAAYVGRTIHSIRCQNYAAFECIVVDNASTDDSIAVIERAIADDSRFTIIKLDQNFGQLVAALRIFDRIRGAFVVVVDADDLLFPEYISSHVQVHLALPNAVSFTSSDVVEIDAHDRVLNGHRVGFAHNCEAEPHGLRPPADVIRLTTISEADYRRLSEVTVTLLHWKLGWAWGPGTSNMYRKSALDRALPDVSRIQGHMSFDGYFCTLLHLMTGSAVVGRALSAYRIHGHNAFSSSDSMLALRAQRTPRPTQSHWLDVLRTLLSRAETFDFILSGNRLWSTIDLLCGMQRTTPRAYFAHSAVQDVLAENFRSLIEAFGARTLLPDLYERLDTVSIWRIARKAYANRVPLSLYWALARESARHLPRSVRAERSGEASKPSHTSRSRQARERSAHEAGTAAAGRQTPDDMTERMIADPFSAGEILPAIFKPGVEANRRANTNGIWSDGWCAARCELLLPGGDQQTISIEGMVPRVSTGFRSKLVVRIDGQQIGTLDLEAGDISAAWPIPESSHPRSVRLEFDAVQALQPPDTRKAAMLIREIAVRPGAHQAQRLEIAQ